MKWDSACFVFQHISWIFFVLILFCFLHHCTSIVIPVLHADSVHTGIHSKWNVTRFIENVQGLTHTRVIHRTYRITAEKFLVSFVSHCGLFCWFQFLQIYFPFVGFEVLRAAVIESSFLRDTNPCSPLKVYRYFGGKCGINIQHWRISQTRKSEDTGHMFLREIEEKELLLSPGLYTDKLVLYASCWFLAWLIFLH
jgi:hypothetical protein